MLSLNCNNVQHVKIYLHCNFGVISLFSSNLQNFSTFCIFYFKNYHRYKEMLSLHCKHVQHVKICLPCNFEVNLITHLGVIALFSSNFKFCFNTFHLIFQKLLEIDVKVKLQKCASCQDLPPRQF